MADHFQPKILSISEIFKKPLRLPEYQRPYKWQVKHVEQLLQDLLYHFRQNKTYRIGTVVLHKYEEHFDIVDGQQRLTTLALLLNSLGEQTSFLHQKFNHTVSHNNIIQNNKFIQSFIIKINDKDKEAFREYILGGRQGSNACQMVCVELEDLDEAFQFFDSQNARGKSLEAYDLLKAYHLREMKDKSKDIILNSVSRWEQAAISDSFLPNLDKIINQILFRLRCWRYQESGQQFTSDDLEVFKGVSEYSDYPYLQMALSSMALAQLAQNSPLIFHNKFKNTGFQIGQTIINGQWFFEYIEYYRKLYSKVFHAERGILKEIRNIQNTELKEGVIAFLDSYRYSNRTGDRYLRNLFECLILAYVDKFGFNHLPDFINIAFIWVYRMRVEQSRIVFESIDNKAAERGGLFDIVERATKIEQVLRFVNSPIKKTATVKLDEKLAELLKPTESME